MRKSGYFAARSRTFGKKFNNNRQEVFRPFVETNQNTDAFSSNFRHRYGQQSQYPRQQFTPEQPFNAEPEFRSTSFSRGQQYNAEQPETARPEFRSSSYHSRRRQRQFSKDTSETLYVNGAKVIRQGASYDPGNDEVYNQGDRVPGIPGYRVPPGFRARFLNNEDENVEFRRECFRYVVTYTCTTAETTSQGGKTTLCQPKKTKTTTECGSGNGINV